LFDKAQAARVSIATSALSARTVTILRVFAANLLLSRQPGEQAAHLSKCMRSCFIIFHGGFELALASHPLDVEYHQGCRRLPELRGEGGPRVPTGGKARWEITESRIKNLLKKPARGGIPAIEKSVKVKLITNVKFFSPEEVQLDM
jgi:hypothetical protein